jgi:serine/threonine protein kinase
MTDELADFKLGGTLGCGAFGKVRKAVHVATGRKVAIKFLMKKKIRSEEDRRRVRRETEILKKIQHPNLLRLLQVVESDETYHLVTELVEGEELFQKINRLGKLD